MIDGGTAAFLQQAHRNNWQQYLASLQPRARRGWDLCVLTANDSRQAAMYRRQLDWRREAGLLPAHTEFVVLPDPAGRRIGSGGATLRALAFVTGAVVEDTPDAECTPSRSSPAYERVLVIHSGGDARRLPHCSIIGKLFARVPRTLPDGRASTIFDEFLISLSGLSPSLPPGALIVSGDVLLVFDHLQLTFRRNGVIGVAAAAPVEIAAQHGVYASGGDGSHRVRAYLHKPQTADLVHWAAVAEDNTVQIDTGLVWMDRPTVDKLVALPQKVRGAEFSLNLYGDLLLPLAASTDLAGYLADMGEGPATPDVQAARWIIWEQMRGTPFTVERLQPAAFIQFGASQDYWRMVAGDPELATMCGWTLDRSVADGPVLINASVAPSTSLDAGAYNANSLASTPPELVKGGAFDRLKPPPPLVVDSHLSGSYSLQGPAIIANVETSAPLALAAELVLHQLPVVGGYVSRVYGLCDDPKRAWHEPGATFLNHPWAAWLAGDDTLAASLWPDLEPSARTLWNARLYPVCADRERSLALALPLQDLANAPPGWRAAWQAAPRLSLAESFRQADCERILAETAALEDLVATQRFYRAIQTEQPAIQAKTLLGTIPGAVTRRAVQAAGWLADADTILQLRGYMAVAAATGDTAWEDRAFATLAEMVAGAALRVAGARGRSADPRSRQAHLAPQPLRVHAAARIDFGGGWTDTPPYSIERGGTVLNAAVTLRGRHPILAEAVSLAEPRLILDSRDIEATSEPVTVGDVLAYANPADPFALLKAALVLRGVISVSDDPVTPLRQVFDQLGVGLQLSTQTFIPRGSGLGTSSIMAGAVLSALAHWRGVTLSEAQLFDEVLCLEQMLTTGGGWQDQVGGLTGGIKLVTTGPGLPQAIRMAPVPLSPQTSADLGERLLLVYTGQQRLAKNLLRNVMIRWMLRDPEMVWIQAEIARLALTMRDALLADDLDTFGALLSEHWSLNKRMDPGCTNPFIDSLFEVLTPYINGGKLAGAGGGGYAMVIARSAQAAQALADTLAARYPGTPVGLWPCGVPGEGLKVQG
jgi:fucokinase